MQVERSKSTSYCNTVEWIVYGESFQYLFEPRLDLPTKHSDLVEALDLHVPENSDILWPGRGAIKVSHHQSIVIIIIVAMVRGRGCLAHWSNKAKRFISHAYYKRCYRYVSGVYL